MFSFVLASLLLVPPAWAGHALAARWLQVEGLPFLAFRARPNAFLAPRSRRLLVHAAGPLAAYLLLVGLFLLLAVVARDFAPVIEPLPDSPAAAAGIESGDRVLAIGDQEVSTFGGLRQHVSRQTDGTIVLTIERHGAIATAEIALGPDRKIGVQPTGELAPLKTSALAMALVQPLRSFFVQAVVLFEVASGERPVEGTIISTTQDAVKLSQGFGAAWWIAALAGTASMFWPLLALLSTIAAVTTELRARADAMTGSSRAAS